MLTTHLREAENRTIAQMKIVAVIRTVRDRTKYLTGNMTKPQGSHISKMAACPCVTAIFETHPVAMLLR